MTMMIVGDIFSESDLETGEHISGSHGWLLRQCMAQVGLDKRDVVFDTAIPLRPARGNIREFLTTKANGVAGVPEVMKGAFIAPQYYKYIEQLHDRIRAVKPNVILALGAMAAWALLQSSAVKNIRGTVAISPIPDMPKVIVSYHPSSVNADMSLRPILIADMSKAVRESASPIYQRPSRLIWTSPTLDDMLEFERLYFTENSDVYPDIETRADQITCYGFAASPHVAIVVPFYLDDGSSYWKDPAEEVEAWKIITRWLASYTSVFQNGMYDMHFSYRQYGIPTPKSVGDTMLLHHAMQIEMLKGLGFLASVYTDEPSWKFMRKGVKHD